MIDFIKRRVIDKFLKEVPIMKKLLDWLNDPTVAGRKRGLAAAFGVLSVGLKAAAASFVAACAAGTFAASVCAINPTTIASVFDLVAKFLNEIVVPGADAATILFGVWGLWAATQKTNTVKPKTE